MSADNYLFVRKLDNGKFDVTHRSASAYYADQIDTDNRPKMDVTMEGSQAGWKIGGFDHTYATYDECYAAIPPVPQDWINDAPPPQPEQFDTLEQAVMAAHKIEKEAFYPIEYGVSIQEGLM